MRTTHYAYSLLQALTALILVTGQSLAQHDSGQPGRARAIRQLNEAIAAKPADSKLYNDRGAMQFLQGNVRAAIADFDRFIELAPRQASSHWMRGIALYYAGEFAKGREQFESYQKYDGDDVENAAWHFLCVARQEGVVAARKALLPMGNDARVPMRAVYQLLAGTIEPAAVLEAAQAKTTSPELAERQLFYAHLYLGLFAEVQNDPVTAVKHLRAADERAINHFMGHVPRVHLQLRHQGPWSLEALRKLSQFERKQVAEGLDTVIYVNEPWRGQPARVFGYLAYPPKAKQPAPAMVLVHGGGGKAFREWAEMWAQRGYVALAMDLAGQGQDGKRLPDGGPGQDERAKFDGDRVEDLWTYHAVAAVMRGTSLLTSLPEVDADRIGITGISWGGYLTCIVSGLDDRLRVAIPVYGCGFIHENSTWLDTFAKMPDTRRAFWIKHFEPSHYLPQAKLPMLFVNGTNDFAYPLDSYQKSYRLTPQARFCVTVNMPHGHKEGWAPAEIGYFADQHLRGGTPLIELEDVKRMESRVSVPYRSTTPVAKAQLHFTLDVDQPWNKRKWQTVAANVGEKQIEAELPAARSLVYFLTVTDGRPATVSTAHEILKD